MSNIVFNCLPQPKQFTEVCITNYFLEMADADPCAAALLHYFETCVNNVVEYQLNVVGEEDYEPLDEDIKHPASISFLVERLNSLFHAATISKSLELLESKKYLILIPKKGDSPKGYVLNHNLISMDITSLYPTN